MAEQHLDESALATLKDIMLDGFGLLVATFVNDSLVRMQMLSEGTRQGDAAVVWRTAHSFKGSSSNMAAPRLAALCHQLEQLAREGQLDGAPALIEAIVREFELVRGLLEATPTSR